eukprot:2657855-Rhodomonas_salina.1
MEWHVCAVRQRGDAMDERASTWHHDSRVHHHDAAMPVPRWFHLMPERGPPFPVLPGATERGNNPVESSTGRRSGNTVRMP